MRISKTFNTERLLQEYLDRFSESKNRDSLAQQQHCAKELVKFFKIKELPYKHPKTNFKINSKSHGIDHCDWCKKKTYQTAYKERGWVCDKCDNEAN